MPAPWNRRRVPAAEPVTPPAHNHAMIFENARVGADGQVELFMRDGMAVVPPKISWQVRPGAFEAHAYSTDAGWMRSVCRAERWTVALDPATEDVPRCNSCAILVDGAPGEVTEAFGG